MLTAKDAPADQVQGLTGGARLRGQALLVRGADSPHPRPPAAQGVL